MSYNTYESLLKGRVDLDVFLTMNVSKSFYDENYKSKMEDYFAPAKFLNGTLRIVPVCDTLQVNDYSKYEIGSFSESHKKEVHETEFPADLERAFQIGAESRGSR